MIDAIDGLHADAVRSLGLYLHGDAKTDRVKALRVHEDAVDALASGAASMIREREAEIARLRARAEGREVVEVETFYRVRHVDGLYEPRVGLAEEHVEADDAWRTDDIDWARRLAGWANDGAHVVRVTVTLTITRRRIVRAEKA